DGKAVRHDAGPAAELLRQEWPQLHVRGRQQVERDHRRVRHVDLHRVLDEEPDAVLYAGRLRIGFRLHDEARVDVHADAAGAELQRRGNDNAAVTASEVVDDVVG